MRFQLVPASPRGSRRRLHRLVAVAVATALMLATCFVAAPLGGAALADTIQGQSVDLGGGYEMVVPMDDSWGNDPISDPPGQAANTVYSYGGACAHTPDTCVNDIETALHLTLDESSVQSLDQCDGYQTRSLLDAQSPITLTVIRAVGVGAGVAIAFYYANSATHATSGKAAIIGAGAATGVIADKVLEYMDGHGAFTASENWLLTALKLFAEGLKQTMLAAGAAYAGAQSCGAGTADVTDAVNSMPLENDPEIGIVPGQGS